MATVDYYHASCVQDKPYKAFNDHCHCYTTLLYLIVLVFYLLQFGFVPLFLYYHYFFIRCLFSV
jgi:hypothetical protein